MSSVVFNVIASGVIGLVLLLAISSYVIKYDNMLKKKEAGVYSVIRLPSVAQLFMNVASRVLGGKSRKKDLTPLRFEYDNQIVSRDHATRYLKVCGFPLPKVEDFEVPLTYPQLLGFRMQLMLLLDQSFPFPALGLVHISNRVRKFGKVVTGIKVNIVVRCEDEEEFGPILAWNW